ncbi:MAG TPA: carboxypeptidase regulatory-like domain-containing protein, partial [Pyrinomonadaceae bacterium]|nr:carboxypeptidase regulatory-like domain-containing protein [Pyrinomonadaceae bacterium]
MSRIHLILIVASLGVFYPVHAQQATTATLGGRVSDPNEASIRGAVVTAVHKATGARRKALTNDEGLYVIANLPAGEYEVTTQAKGFSDRTFPNVVLLVGQSTTLNVGLQLPGIETAINAQVDGENAIDTTASVVDGIIKSREIDGLPLNGRNFLELALLVPGNSPAPNFDPTKTNTVVVSSAGQLGRGGNVTVDGADNNDDVVGGAVQNISQEAVQEFQIATNRFSAQLGRSGSSVVNIVTKAGTNELHGSGSFYFRHRALQGLPATFDKTLGQTPPFHRQQYAFALGGPLKQNRAWIFGSLEYRHQNGAVLVGARDLSTRSIRRGFATAPLRDTLTTERFDWQPNLSDHLTLRYSFQRSRDTTASTLIRSIGSASQRQAATNRTHSLLANYTRVFTSQDVNSLSFSVNDFINRTLPVSTGPQLTFPSIQDGVSFRVPQQTKQRRFQVADTFTTIRGNHTLNLGGEVQRVESDFNLGVFQQGRVELIEDFPDFDRNSDGRVDDNDLLFAVTLRSGKPNEPLVIPDDDNTYVAFFFQDDWRVHPQLTLNLGLRYERDSDVKNV